MKFITDVYKEELLRNFENLKNKVFIKMFTQKHECLFCRETRKILEDLNDLSEKIDLEFYIIDKHKEKFNEYKIDKIPAIVILDSSERDYGIRFYGSPSGYEFNSLISAVTMHSNGKIKLTNESKLFLNEIKENIKLEVFVAPNTIFSSSPVILAHQIAFYCKNVKADMIDITQFPQIANKYHIQEVPRTVINNSEIVEGSVPEYVLLKHIKNFLT